MKDGLKTKRPGYIKLYPERWIFGSTREEMTNAERAVWTDFLCLAYLNDPPGQIDFTSFRRLAKQLDISQRLLLSTIRNALLNRKIRVIQYSVDPETNKKIVESELVFDQLDTKLTHFDSSRSKNGITLYAILILKWNEYQSEYLRQKPYRKGKSEGAENDESLGPDSVTQVTARGEERRKQEKKQNETNPPNENPSTSPLPSNSPPKKAKTIKEEFLEMLRACHSYPFSESLDSLLFDFSLKEYPGINILEQTQKKVVWWKTHEDALRADPRTQLKIWFAEEAKFKGRGGPQKIGDVMAAVDDADHRRFLGQFIERHKRSKEEEGY